MAPPHRETRHLHRCRDCASLCTCGGPKIRPKILHSASTKAFSVASRPPVIQGLRKICTTPLSLRLLGNLAKEGQSPQMWSRKSPHRLYLTTFVSDDQGRLQISTLLIFDPEKPTALQDLNKSPHRLYLTTFSSIAPRPVSKTRVAPGQRERGERGEARKR